MTTKVNSKGQIVIPPEIGARHMFRPGDLLAIEERNDEIVVKKPRRKRQKTLVQWMLECPVKGLRIPARNKDDFLRIPEF